MQRIKIEKKVELENKIGISINKIGAFYDAKENIAKINGEITGKIKGDIEDYSSLEIKVVAYGKESVLDSTSAYIECKSFLGFDIFSEQFYDLPEKPEYILVFPKLS